MKLKEMSDLSEANQKKIARLKDNLLICFVKRSGGVVSVPIKEVDEATDIVTIEVVDKEFILVTQARN